MVINSLTFLLVNKSVSVIAVVLYMTWIALLFYGPCFCQNGHYNSLTFLLVNKSVSVIAVVLYMTWIALLCYGPCFCRNGVDVRQE